MTISGPGRTALAATVRDARPAGRLTPRDHFYRACTAAAVNLVGPRGAAPAVTRLYPNDEAAAYILRAATTPGTTTGTGWAAEIAGSATADFVGGLAPQSAAAALFKRAMPLDFERFARLIVPTAASGASAWFTAEDEPIGVTSAALDTAELLPRKLAALVVLSEETLKRSTAEVAVRTLLNEAVAKALDVALFDVSAGSDACPAGLRYGVPALAAMPGGDDTAILEDLKALVGAVAGVGGQPVLVCHPLQALTLSVRAPGLTVPVLASGHLAPGLVITVVPSALAFALGQIELDPSREAVVHMSDTPAELVASGPPAVADPLRSMYQTNCVALRLLLDVSWVLRGSGAVAWADVGW